MVEIYCRAQHRQRGGLCEDCDGLFAYASKRLDNCVFKDDKPTCKKCPVHCYRRDERERMRRVMVFAGPRMLLAHPLLAILHLLDERRDAPSGRPA
jgi:hypothetical protein